MSPQRGVVRLLVDDEDRKAEIERWAKANGTDLPRIECITNLEQVGKGGGNPQKLPPSRLLLLRPPTRKERSVIRAVGIRAERLYCSAVMEGVPLSLAPTALHPCTPVEALAHWFASDESIDAARILDETTLQRCVARRDGWYGLQRLGLSWQDAERILREIKATNLPPGVSQGNRLRLAELDLLLQEGNIPDAPTFIAPPEPEDKKRRLSSEMALRPLLIFYRKGRPENRHADAFRTGDITAVEFIGPVQWKEWCLELMGDEAFAPWHRMRLEHGEILLRFRVEVLGRPCDRITKEALIGRLLGVLTGTGRPLRDWGLTLFLPFSLPPDWCVRGDSIEKVNRKDSLIEAAGMLETSGKPPDESTRFPYDVDRGIAESQAMLYFSPAVRQQVEKIRLYRLKTPERYRLDVNLERSAIPRGGSGVRWKGLPLSDLMLYCHPDGQALLAVRLQWERSVCEPSWRSREGCIPWWRDLLDPARWPDAWSSQMEIHLVIVRALRWLYRSFPEERQEREERGEKFLPIQLVDVELNETLETGFTPDCPFNAPLFHLLGQFFPSQKEEGGNAARRFWDEFCNEQESDRLYISATYALAGSLPSTSTETQVIRRLFSHALYVDSGKDGFVSQQGFAYDRAFVEQRLAEHGYRRWEGMGTFIGHTDNATAYLGFGDHFVYPIARVHVPYIYDRFVILALLQHAVLRQLQRRAQQLPVDIGERSDWRELYNLKQELRKLRRRFIDFTNRHWIHYPTEQVQGKEMYRILSRTFALDETYALAREKLEKAEAFATGAVQERMARIGRVTSYVGLSLGLAGLFFTDVATALLFGPFYDLTMPVDNQILKILDPIIRLSITSLLGLAILGFFFRKEKPIKGCLWRVGAMLFSLSVLSVFSLLKACIPIPIVKLVFILASMMLMLLVVSRLWKEG